MPPEVNKQSELKKATFFDRLRQRQNNTTLNDIRNIKTDYGDIIPCFIYDHMMKGEAEDVYLEDSAYFGPATTHEDDFILFKKSGVPLMFQKTRLIMTEHALVNTIDCRRVQGDLYGLSLDMVCYFDTVYKNHDLYERVEIPLMLHTPEGATHFIKHAFVWLSVYDKWKHMKSPIRDRMVRAPIINSRYIPEERPYRAEIVQKVMFPEKKRKPHVWKNDYTPQSAGMNDNTDGSIITSGWPDVEESLERLHPFGNEFAFEMGGGGA